MNTKKENPSSIGQGKSLESATIDSHFKTQMQTTFEYLMNHIATASMVTAETGVYQKSICRYKRDLEKSNRLWEIEKKPCKITGFKAWYLSTNPNLAPKGIPIQLNLF